jgi:cellulose biosynthesis protein BcsQ
MAKRITFFNNKSRAGKTTLVYHVAYKLCDLGYKVLIADFDPQSNITAMCLQPERLEQIYLEPETNNLTITDAMQPVFDGEGYEGVHLEKITNQLHTAPQLIIGNLRLSRNEDILSEAWTNCLDGRPDAFKKTIVFDTILKDAEAKENFDFVLIDIGPNLGAINRAVLVATDYVIMPVASDLFSLQGIENLGQTLRAWKAQWYDRCQKKPDDKPNKPKLILPNGKMQATGYIALQHTARESRPVKAYLKWSNRIPYTYRKFVLQDDTPTDIEFQADPHCLATLKHYHSLMPMAMEAHKPIFNLRPADGAIGAHFQAAQQVGYDFDTLSKKIIAKCD